MPDPFISTTDLGDYLGEDLSASDAAVIVVDAACDIVRTLTEQTINQVDDEEITLDGTGTDALLLPERPVIDVTDVTENDTALVVDDDYKLNGNSILIRMPGLIEAPYQTESHLVTYWTPGRQNIVVTYSHGYADADIPRDLRMVALSIAARLLQSGAQGTTAEESLGAYSIRYVTNGNGAGSDLTKTETAILRKHKMAK